MAEFDLYCNFAILTAIYWLQTAWDTPNNENQMNRLLVQGLVKAAGWQQQAAEEHFFHFAPMFEIGDEVDFILSEVRRLRLRYPKIMVAPLLYRVEDNRLYLIQEGTGS